MKTSLPEHYTSLPPFRSLFATGTPVLMYHKLGPRPRGVRLKGLYVSERLFRRQLEELRAAGFASGTLAECAGGSAGDRPEHPLTPALSPKGERESAAATPVQRVVITFDDGFVNALKLGIDPLGANHFQAIQFLVADRIGRTNEWDLPAGEVQEPLMDAAQIRDWLAAGHRIGSHTLTHPFLTQLSRPAAREEITASRKTLEDRFGVPIRDFCYPYGDCNEAVRDQVGEAGYLTACTTAAGVNDARTDPLALRRFMARHATRSLKHIVRRIWR